jgi:uracil-DNA glycosylase
MSRLEELRSLLKEARKCTKCEADSQFRWLFPPNELPRIMLISETPGPYEQSLPDRVRGSHWDFWGLAEELFRDKFRYLIETGTTVYWTHYQKCSKKISPTKDGYLGVHCADTYLDREIQLVDPKLIIAFGMKAGEFLVQRYHLACLPSLHCRRRTGRPGTFQTMDDREYAILCHPSGARRYQGCTVFKDEYEKLINTTRDGISQLMP